MAVTLESLPMCAGHLDAARTRVQELAYCMWQDAGCPAGRELEFWLAAEKYWVEHEFVPDDDRGGNMSHEREQQRSDEVRKPKRRKLSK